MNPKDRSRAANAAPLGEPVPLAKSLSDVEHHYDVVIIGSGYGGAVSASRLARAGRRVCVLERGREFLTGDFPARFPELRLEFQVTGSLVKTGKRTALYDIRLGQDMHVLVGCGLGGGSLINAGVALRPVPRVFADAAWPDEIARDQDGDLAEGFARARAWLRPARHVDAMAMTKSKALQQAAPGLNAIAKPAEVVVSFSDNVNPAGVHQPGCTFCGDCCGGCNVGAKNTVALSYLPDAVNHGAQLFTLARVDHIARDAAGGSDGGWAVHVARLNEDGKPYAGDKTGKSDNNNKDSDAAVSAGAEGTPVSGGKVATAATAGSRSELIIRADIVIVSAGTLGSSEILLRSAARGLALSPRLGHSFSANGDIIAFGYGAQLPINAVGVGHPAKVELEPVGACVSSYIEISDEDDFNKSLNIQEGVMPSALAPALPALFIPNGRLLGALKSLIAGVYKGPFRHLQTFFAVSHDSAAGVFSLVADRLSLSWPNAKDEPAYARLDAALASLTRAAGASYVKNPLAGSVMGHQPATAHPLGGCAMGADVASGVVNHKGQVFDAGIVTTAGAGADTNADIDAAQSQAVHRGLYVIDGSIIPRSLGVNPLYTITALAERAMMLLAQDQNLHFDTAPANVAAPSSPRAPAQADSPNVGQHSS